jgi:thioredoxin reductase (NADPH)
MPDDMIDCLIIGGGPAGLTTAIYLARFHLSVRVIDAGDGRAITIPCSHNHAGFPEGIAGSELISRMIDQAQRYGAIIDRGRVTRLDKTETGFAVEWGEGAVRARTVLIATGVRNRRPSVDQSLHDEALAAGLIRYCPICDGYEVTDQKVAVIGTAQCGVDEALFLRSYTADLMLLAPDRQHELSSSQRQDLARSGIRSVEGPAHISRIEGNQIVVETAEGELIFDSIYPALGSDTSSLLAELVGVATTELGCIKTDTHQRTNVVGLYAAGDVVLGLDQISNAMGQGGVAATAIRNDLQAISPLMR